MQNAHNTTQQHPALPCPAPNAHLNGTHTQHTIIPPNSAPNPVAVAVAVVLPVSANGL